MKRSHQLLIVAVLLFGTVFLVGARRGNRAPVEIGRTYTIQTYPSPLTGRVTDVLGNGWWTLQLTDGREIDVNVMAAFSVAELK